MLRVEIFCVIVCPIKWVWSGRAHISLYEMCVYLWILTDLCECSHSSRSHQWDWQKAPTCETQHLSHNTSFQLRASGYCTAVMIVMKAAIFQNALLWCLKGLLGKADSRSFSSSRSLMKQADEFPPVLREKRDDPGSPWLFSFIPLLVRSFFAHGASTVFF